TSNRESAISSSFRCFRSTALLSTAVRNYGDECWLTRIPLLAEEGWRDSLIEAGAPGAKREPDRAKPQGWSVRQNQSYAGLTTPSAPLRWLRDIFLLAQPPLLCEEGNTSR